MFFCHASGFDEQLRPFPAHFNENSSNLTEQVQELSEVSTNSRLIFWPTLLQTHLHLHQVLQWDHVTFCKVRFARINNRGMCINSSNKSLQIVCVLSVYDSITAFVNKFNNILNTSRHSIRSHLFLSKLRHFWQFVLKLVDGRFRFRLIIVTIA